MVTFRSNDLSTLLKNTQTGWVLISEDQKRIIAKAKTLVALDRKIKDIGNPKGFVMVAAKDYSNYIGC